MRPLTPQQVEVYNYIASYIQDHGYSPTYSDIAQTMEVELTSVPRLLWQLRDQGYITYLGAGSRMIYLTAHVPDCIQHDNRSETSQKQQQKRSKRRSKSRSYSPHRQHVYDFIETYVAEHQYPPALREIAQGIGIGATTVKYYVNMLRDQGYLTFMPGKSRSISLTNKPFAQDDKRADAVTASQSQSAISR